MKKLTHNEAIDKLSKNNPNIILLDQYKSSREKNFFKCLICNCEWKANVKGVINGNNGCPECGKKKAKETLKYNITTDDFKNKIKKIFGDKISIISEYTNHNNKINVKCNICNHIWSTKPKSLIAKNGCIKCGHIEKGKKHRKSHEKFINEINLIHNNRLSVIGIYNTCDDRIDVKCNICNHEWKPVSGRLLRRGCPKCNFSKGELLIEDLLKKLNIDFKPQYTFEGLKTKANGVPIFDFAIFDNKNIKCIIEYDGEQHFKAVKKWGGIERLKRQQEIDKFKNNYCYKNNIKIIRIPYTEIKNINIEYIKRLLL